MNHQITVKELRKLLLELKEDDVLVPNQVKNFSIVRQKKTIGYIELLEFSPGVIIFEKGKLCQ